MIKKIFLLSVVAAVVPITACNNTDNSNQKLTVASDTSSVKYQCPMKCEGDTA